MPARRGSDYEAWVLAHAAVLWNLLVERAVQGHFEREVWFVGSSGFRWRVDVAGRSGDRLLLIECKDKRIGPQEFVGTLARFADIARKHSELAVYGAVVVSRFVSGDPARMVRAATSLISVPPNFKGTRFVLSRRSAVPGVLVAWRLEEGDVQAFAAPINGGGSESLESLRARMVAPSFLDRLTACLQVRADPRAPQQLMLSAQLETALCNMHIGATYEAILDAQEVQRRAADARLYSAGYTATLVELATRTRLRLVAGRSRRPGAGHTAAVARLLPQLDGQLLIDALHLLGAWHGAVGEVDSARKALLRTVPLLDDSEEGRYKQLLTSVRLIELEPQEERPDRAAALLPLVPLLSPVHLQPASELLDRMRRGVDTSIATSFAVDA